MAKGVFLYTTKLHKESWVATGELVRRLEGLGYRVAIQSSEDVDKDLCYLPPFSASCVASTAGLVSSLCVLSDALSILRVRCTATPYIRVLRMAQ